MDLTTKSDVFANLDDNLANAVIQEEYFVRYYLPFYRVPNPPMEAMTNLVQYHLSITENPYQYLDVYRGDKLLFTVPPLYRDDIDQRLNDKHVAMWKKIFNFYDIKPVKYDPNGKVEVVDANNQPLEPKDIEVTLTDDL